MRVTQGAFSYLPDLTDDEIARRVAAYRAPAQEHTSVVLAKYAKLVSSAAEGAVTR